MKRLCELFASLLLLCLTAPASFAIPINFMAQLTGANENPANASPATGTALIVLDTADNTLSFNVVFSGLVAPTTAAHIHCCTNAPNNIGVAVDSGAFLINFPIGVTSGSYTQVLDTSLASTYRAAFITNFGGGTVPGAESALETGLLLGRAYFNIHTTQFGGGEIRGFFQQVPEPGSVALLGLGLAVAGWARRRKR
jgi:CHRD domain/PEP-CTERM motif